MKSFKEHIEQIEQMKNINEEEYNCILEAISNYKYKMPEDKEKLLFDFYMSTFLTPTGNDNLDYVLQDLKKDLYSNLKKELLDAVFFSITSELRHIFDANQINKEFSKETFKFLQEYAKEISKVKTSSNIKIFMPRGKKVRGEGEYLESQSERVDSYKAALRASKNHKLPIIKAAMEVFDKAKWKSGFGGKNWAIICNGWLKLREANTIKDMQVWIDHVYDLQHNNDTVLNKVQRYYKSGYSWINKALEFKKNVKDPYEIYSKVSTSMKIIAPRIIKANTGKTFEEWLIGSKPTKKTSTTPKKTIEKDKGNLKGDVWEGGTWKHGIWKHGIWKDGTWEGGVWENGLWSGGLWKGDVWERGTWEHGLWKGGTWENGLWKDGTWEVGTWKGGKWEKGTWEHGLWKGGTWENGAWICGWIYSPNGKGNIDFVEQREDKFVFTKVNPKKYFN
jgi:hypothetical protein